MQTCVASYRRYCRPCSDNPVFRFAPIRPRYFEQVRIPLRLRDCRIEVTLGPDAVRYALRDGERLSFRHYEETIVLEGCGTVVEREYG